MVKRCLILGSANCLRADLRGALSMAEFEGVVACKGAGLEWRGRLDAWVSLHPKTLPRDIERRRRRGLPDADRTYGHERTPGVSHSLQYKFPGQVNSGSSGLFALRVAMNEFDFDQFVLCGIPLVKEYGRIDGKEHWSGANSFRLGWNEVLPQIKNSVRSMSGWTKTILGPPTPEWLGVDVGITKSDGMSVEAGSLVMKENDHGNESNPLG